MDIKHLSTFICTAELGSFTRAAEKLGYSQSTVSFQIKQLENELGIPLFERVGHTIALTDRGTKILALARRIEGIYKQMQETASPPRELTGHIRLAVADSLSPVIAGSLFLQLHKTHPGITMQVINAGTQSMFRMIDRNEVDFVYTLDSRIYDLSYRLLFEKAEAAHFVASASHPLAHRSLALQDLLSFPFILTEHGMSYRRLMDEQLARLNVHISPVFEVGSPSLICQLLTEDDSISFLPDFATRKYVETGKLVRLDVADFNVELYAQLLIHRDKWISPQMQALTDLFIGGKV